MDNKLDIAHVSTPWYKIPTLKYGGVEKVLFDLICAQNKHHEITLYSPGDCNYLQGISISSLFEDGVADQGYDRTAEVAQAIFATKKILKKHHEIIHIHNLYPMLAVAELIGLPIVFTYHSVLRPEVKFLNKICNSKKIIHVFLSEAHRKEFSHIRNTKVVHYGINTKNIPLYKKHQKKDYFAFIGSLTEEKGILEAISIAKKSKIKLKIAGKIQPRNREFYNKKIKPAIEFEKNVTFVGEITNEERNKFLGQAKAMLFPTKWNEPFGRVMLESLAAGTPVIAFRNGSVPEILNEKVGSIIETQEEMIEELLNFKKFNPLECRRHVENNFSIRKMVENYDKIYKELIH